jgi:RNA polymerase sigma-70 factor, ECF subfamily
MYDEMSARTATALEHTHATLPRVDSRRASLKRDCFDREYVQRLKDGDGETERHFAGYFGKLLLIKLRARLRDKQMIEDLRQETFVRVLTTLKSNNGLYSPESLGAFVNSVCNNLLFDLYRRQSSERAIGMKDGFDPPDGRASAELQLASQERCEQVRQVLGELSPKDRELLRMVFYEGVESARICRSFGVQREYLRVLIHRAKCRFRQCWLKRAQT